MAPSTKETEKQKAAIMAEAATKHNPETTSQDVCRQLTADVLAKLIAQLGELEPDESPVDLLMRIKLTFRFLRSSMSSRDRN